VSRFGILKNHVFEKDKKISVCEAICCSKLKTYYNLRLNGYQYLTEEKPNKTYILVLTQSKKIKKRFKTQSFASDP
jgi:hypothetical protein